MRFSSLHLASLALVTLAAASCGGNECVPGVSEPCYTGDESTKGVGQCSAGHFVCTAEGVWSKTCEGQVLPAQEVCDGLDNDCDGEVDEEVRNACGGCGQLSGNPGKQCAPCSVFACDGPESVRCLSPEETSEESCVTAEGCEGGTYACVDGQVYCDGPKKNECGLCGGAAVPERGQSCTTAEGCPGTLVCDATMEGTVCVGLKKNNCGICGEPDVPKVGFSCTAANGCPGTLACDATKKGTVCTTAMRRNNCGACVPDDGTTNGDVPGVDPLDPTPCTAASGCEGILVCDPSGLRAVCWAPPKNNCGDCGVPDVPDINGTCWSEDGCAGRWLCDPDGPGRICRVSEARPNDIPGKNNCGVCNQPDVPEVAQPTTCKYREGAFECDSVMVCNSQGTGATCAKVDVNECGACGKPKFGKSPGATCTVQVGNVACRDGRLVCSEDKTELLCLSKGTPHVPMWTNACGLCEGPEITDLGAPCQIDGCEGGKKECNANGDGTVCVGPIKNACGLCGGPEIVGTEGDACVTPEECISKLVCSPDGTELICEPVPTNECGQCKGPEINPKPGTPCTTDTVCEGLWTCNETLDGVECVGKSINNCGECGKPNVPGIGAPCNDPRTGCPSKLVCSEDKQDAICEPVARNACNECGGDPIPVDKEPLTPCRNEEGCDGHYVCSEDDNSTYCDAPKRNNCGECGLPDVPRVGDECKDENDCTVRMICTPDRKGAYCPNVTSKNACGVCGGTTLVGAPGDPCGSGSCAGALACVYHGNALACDACAADHLVISEIALRTNGESDSFVEIYNPTEATVSLSGRSLWYHDGSSWVNLATFDSGSLEEGQFLLVAHQGFTALAPDKTYSQVLAGNGAVWLMSGTDQPTGPADPKRTDAVGWGSSTYFEGTVAALNGSGSLERKAFHDSLLADMTDGKHARHGNGMDSDSNAFDFVKRSDPQPQNTASPREPRLPEIAPE